MKNLKLLPKKQLTQIILDSEDKKNDFEVNHFPSVVVSLFTIIFSLSIILEIREMLANEAMFYVLLIFLGTFLSYNEVLKNQELRKYFNPEKKANLGILFITFTLSVGLSLIGTYLWVNKGYEMKKESVDRQISIKEKRTDELFDKLNRVKEANKLTDNSEYKQEYANLELQKLELKHVWKQEERKLILNKINVIEIRIREISNKINSENETKIAEIRKAYKDKEENERQKSGVLSDKTMRNSLISYLLCFLTLLNDFVAIMFARSTSEKEYKRDSFSNSEEAKTYLKLRSFLKNILIKKKIGDKMCTWEIKNNNPTWDWDKDVSFLFGVLQTIGVTSVVAKSESVIEIGKEEALIRFDNYFNEIL